jgi:L,D-transpeptidase catalytic domain
MKSDNRSCLSATSIFAFATCLLFLCSCTVKTGAHKDNAYAMEISVPEQKMAVYHHGKMIKTYPVSTSRFGLGDDKGSYKTPLGKLLIAEKIGDGKPLGAVFKSRQWTGEVIKPNSPGRDPIVSRILWLHGLESRNKNAYSRCIYIHGTAAENEIGTQSSYGCVRMKSRDIIELYERVGWGASVEIVDRKLWSEVTNQPDAEPTEEPTIPIAAVPTPAFTPEFAAEPTLNRRLFHLSYFDIEPTL